MTVGLAGLRVMVPVTRDRAELAGLVTAAGAEAIPVEFLVIESPRDDAALESAVRSFLDGGFDWLAVTSRNAVLSMERVARTWSRTLVDAVPPAHVAAVGEATRAVCDSIGLPVALTPPHATARGLVESFPRGTGTVLAPLGDQASAILVRGLTDKGWSVTAVEAYRTVSGQGPTAAHVAALAAGEIDAVLVTSGSMATLLAAACTSIRPSVAIVAIGATTAAAARAAGLSVAAVAHRATYESLLETLAGATGRAAT